MGINLNSLVSLLYAILGVSALSWVGKSIYNQQMLKKMKMNEQTQEALDAASKALKNLSDADLDKRITDSAQRNPK